MNMGLVRAICSADQRGMPKKNQGSGFLKEGFGLEGDAHTGPGDMQISILLEHFMLPVIEKLGYIPEPGSFAENLLISGLTADLFLVGTELKVGGAIIRIIAIGKDKSVKHTYSYEGFSLLADQGLFGEIIKSGTVNNGDSVEIFDN